VGSLAWPSGPQYAREQVAAQQLLAEKEKKKLSMAPGAGGLGPLRIMVRHILAKTPCHPIFVNFYSPGGKRNYFPGSFAFLPSDWALPPSQNPSLGH